MTCIAPCLWCPVCDTKVNLASLPVAEHAANHTEMPEDIVYRHGSAVTVVTVRLSSHTDRRAPDCKGQPRVYREHAFQLA